MRVHLLIAALALAVAAFATVVFSLQSFRSAPPVRVPGHVAGGCAAVPHACGFPDATNTGVPRGMALRRVPGQVAAGRGWRYDRRGWVDVYGDGAVLTGLSITCNVNVTGSGVRIDDDRIEVTGDSFGVSLRHARNVTIEHSDIYGRDSGTGRMLAGVKDIFGDSAGIKVIGDNIWHASTGVQIESGLVQASYIHAPGYRHGDHINGITSNGGKTGSLIIKHNTILIDHNQTDAVGLFEDFGVQANRSIVDNLLGGGGYTIYAGQKRGGPQSYNIHIAGNRISRIYYPAGGYYGQVTAFSRRGRGNAWSGNSWLGAAPGTMAGAIPLP